MGGVGFGKTHLATALAHAACLRGHSVLFTTAMDIINTLIGGANRGPAQSANSNNTSTRLILVVDEFGYLPIDKPAPTCSSRSSASATSAAPSS